MFLDLPQRKLEAAGCLEGFLSQSTASQTQTDFSQELDSAAVYTGTLVLLDGPVELEL